MSSNFGMWGPAGGTSPQGQPFSRFQLGGDPSPYYPILASKTINLTRPAHQLADGESPYFYGTRHVGGIVNMLYMNGTLMPLIGPVSNNGSDIQLLLGGTSGGNYDAIVNAWYSFPMNVEALAYTGPPRPAMMVQGEFAWQDTTGASGHYGAAKEQFVVSGTGVSVNIGSTAVTGVGGTTWNTDALSFAYGYTPNFNTIRIGDVLEIINAGVSQFYRIASVSTTSITIFPAYNGASNATNQPYKIWRTGFGSYSRAVVLYISGVPWVIYAGNQWGEANPNLGTIQAVNANTLAHQMCPGAPAAADVIYYKGFILYGGDGAVGWSAAGAPSGSGSPIFGAGDFPPGNISTRLSEGFFVSFEQLGEQLLAIYTDSIWLVQSTGGVPEFAFYLLPEVTGALYSATLDQQFGGNTNLYQTFGRTTTTGRASVYYSSWTGTMAMRNLSSVHIAAPVERFALTPGFGFSTSTSYSYDNGLDRMMWVAGGLTPGPGFEQGLLMDTDTSSWTILDFSAQGRVHGIGGEVNPNGIITNRPYRTSSIAYWFAKRIWYLQSSPEAESSAVSTLPWTWATRIVTQGEIYPGFTLGSIRPVVRAPLFQNPTLTIQVYAGNSPYNMQTWGPPIVVNYQYALPSARYSVSSGKCDSAYIGFTVTGSSWVELAGLALYSSDTQPAR